MNRLWRTTGAIDYELLPRNTAMREHEKRILSRKGCGDGVARCCPRVCGGGWIEHGERSCRGRDEAVNLFWSEKLVVIIDQLQILAVLWVAGCPAASDRFPQDWCVAAGNFAYVNGDFNGMRAYALKALNGTEAVDDEEVYSAQGTRWGWAIMFTPGLLVATTALYFLFIQQKFKYMVGLRARFVPFLERSFLSLLYLGYMPWCLYVSRHLLCVEMQAVTVWQRQWSCPNLDASQFLCAAKKACLYSNATLTGADGQLGDNVTIAPGRLEGLLAWVCILLFGVGLPWMLAALVGKGAPFAGRRKHELWVQSMEAEYLLHLSSLWSHQHYPLISSFNRSWTYFYPLSLVFKLGMAVTLAATWDLDVVVLGNPSQGDAVRDLALLGMLLLFFGATLFRPPFRLRTSNHVLTVSLGANILTAIPRCLLSLNFSATPLFTRLGLLLPLHHAVLTLILLTLLLLLRAERWPVTIASLRYSDYRLPRALVDPRALALPLEEFEMEEGASRRAASQKEGEGEFLSLTGAPGRMGVSAVVEWARGELYEEQLRTRLFVRPMRLLTVLDALDTLLHVLKKESHVLQNAVEDVMEDTLAFYNLYAHLSLYDYPPLHDMILQFRRRMDQRDAFLRLSGGLRRRVLLKLYCCAVFIGMRRTTAKARHRARPSI